MRLTLCCIWLLLVIICGWECMGMPKQSKKRPSALESHSKEHDHSKEHKHPKEHESHSEENGSHSNENDRSKEHKHSKEHESDPEEYESHSKEHDHSKEHKHSKEHESHSKERGSHSNEHDRSKEHKHSKEHESHSNEHKSSREKDSSSSSERWSSQEKDSSCMNRKKNKEETDIDCGGKKCLPCADNKKCLVDRDCMSKFCKNGKCIQGPTRMPSTTSTRPTRPTTTSVTITTQTVTTTTTEEPTTTTEEPTTTTEEPTTTTEVPTTTEEVVVTEEPAINQFTCDPECKNGGTCTADNSCICSADFSGPTCEVQSAGLCLDKETLDVEPILQVTFGKGSSQFSNASPAQFNFTTTYTQQRERYINDGYFTFINSIYNHYDAWHAEAKDHTGDEGGYMYLVNADFKAGQFYSGRVDNLCVGLRYEFSVYLANLCKKTGRIEPNVLFEVRSVDGNELLAQLNSGNIPERDTLTWEKYGLSFIATKSSVNLLMISNTKGGNGNDIVIDDIALRVCAHKGSGFCPSN